MGDRNMQSFQPLQEKAYTALQEMIERRELEPGKIYSLTQIAKEMKISRTPLKDAVVRLSQAKYVDIIPSKGFCLHEISESDIDDTCQVRQAIENMCAMALIDSQYSSYGRVTMRQMAVILDEMKAMADQPDKVDEFLELDIRFHNALVGFLENKALEEIYASHSYQIRTLAKNSLTTNNRMQNTCDEHEAILNAITDKNYEACYHAVQKHLISTKELSLLVLKDSK